MLNGVRVNEVRKKLGYLQLLGDTEESFSIQKAYKSKSHPLMRMAFKYRRIVSLVIPQRIIQIIPFLRFCRIFCNISSIAFCLGPFKIIDISEITCHFFILLLLAGC